MVPKVWSENQKPVNRTVNNLDHPTENSLLPSITEAIDILLTGPKMIESMEKEPDEVKPKQQQPKKRKRKTEAELLNDSLSKSKHWRQDTNKYF